MPVHRRLLITSTLLISFCASGAHARLSAELKRVAPLSPPPGGVQTS